MTKYIAKKCLILLLVLWAVSVTVFGVLFLLPSDPAQIILGMNATAETLANLRHQLGLDLPPWKQYITWISGLLSGRSSLSITYQLPVSELIWSAMSVTGPLALLSLVFTALLALPAGIMAALRQNRPSDICITALSQAGISIPDFWLGIILILVFAVGLHLFPAGGFPGWGKNFWGCLRALLLPAASLALVRAAVITRMTRAAMIEVMHADYIQFARAKGMPRKRVIFVHGLRCALIPIITVFGFQAGQLIAGAIIIENVFFLPGLGRLVFQAIGQRDLPVVREVVLVMAAAVILINFLIDLAYKAADPRLEME